MRASHQALRDGTRDAHDALDGLFARYDLSSAQSYADFLSAHAQALLPVEAALDAAGAGRVIPDWPSRKSGELIRADLASLGRALPPLASFALQRDDAAIAGTLYVVEGSRLGGRHLARRVASGLAKTYLDRGQAPRKWPFLLDRIDTLLYDDDRMRRAIASAHDAFAAFAAAGRAWLAKD